MFIMAQEAVSVEAEVMGVTPNGYTAYKSGAPLSQISAGGVPISPGVLSGDVAIVLR